MTSAARARPQPIPDSALVLANRPLQAGVSLAETSRFGDDTWALNPALHQLHQRSLSLNLATVPAQFQHVCKELFFAMLTLDLPPGVEPCRIVSVRGHFSRVKEFLTWVDARGVTTLDGLTGQDFADYGEMVAAQRVSESTREQKRGTPRLFWLYRSKLVTDRLGTDPALVLGEPYSGPSRRGNRENTTDRIPEAVIAPLLVWALRWIDDFADDILRGQQQWLSLRASTAEVGRAYAGHAHLRLSEVLDQHRRRGRRLPGRTATVPTATPGGGAARRTVHVVNVQYLAGQARCHPATLYRDPSRRLVRQAVAELGVAEDTYLDVEVRGRIDGRPWLAAIRYDDVPHFARMLQTACYIVIAFLSGMRDSEVKHMQRGCLSVWRDDTGRAVRHKVTSQAFKGEDDVHGVEATWIINASVARAIGVLERLQPLSQDLLFAVPATSRGYGKNKANPVKTSHSTNRDLAAFVEWINTYCTSNDRADAIPDVNGQQWPLMTRQFRRTLAWFIARQPGGVIAGAIQYRHLSVQMFEGYAGTSASGFRHEVEAEQAIRRGEKLTDIVLTPDHHRLAGPAAAEAHARLAAFDHQLQLRGKVITDGKRLERHMRRHDPNIYPGEYVTCVYNPDRALCRRNDAGDGPSLPDCQPLRCRNVALTARNTEALNDWLARLDQTLASGVLAPYIRHRLEHRRAQVAQFLASAPATAGDPR